MRGWQLGLAGLLFMCSPSVPIHAEPPAETEAGAGDGGISTFAIDSLSFGDVDDAGQPNFMAWKSIGYDLDGKITAKTSTDVCTLHTGAPTLNQLDGVGGRDNAFGNVVVPILTTFLNPISVCVGTCVDAGKVQLLSNVETQDVQAGKFTLQIQVDGLSDDTGQDATGLTAQIFTSDAFDGTSPPAFDSTTDWPVQTESLVDPTNIAGGTIARFQNAYVTHGTFVAGTLENVTVPLHAEINGVPFTIAIHDAIITFDHASAHDAVNGVLAGVLDGDEYTAVFKSAVERGTTGLCGTAFEGIADQLKQAFDILADRANMPGTPCTSISVGIGFHARRIANPTKIGHPPPALPNLCDAGDD